MNNHESLESQLDDLKNYLTKHNETDLDLVKLAGKVGEIAAKEENSEELLEVLKERLKELKEKEGEPNQPNNPYSFDFFVWCWKVVLAFGILVASQENPEKQKKLLDESLLSIVNGPKFPCPDLCRRLALSELTYVDQYLYSLSDENNESKDIEKSGENNESKDSNDIRKYCKDKIEDHCLNDAWASPIRDYIVNIKQWELRTDWARKLKKSKVSNKEKEEQQNQKLPQVFAICSVKGGVGKTITAMGLYGYASKILNRRALLVDVDITGCTLQYHLNIPDCTKGLSAVPIPNKKVPFDKKSFIWCYPTLSNAYEESRKEGKKEKEKKEDLKSCFLSNEGNKKENQSGVVLMPDSPTLCGRLENYWTKVGESTALQETLELILNAAMDEKFEYIFLDFSPGLVGRNGSLLRWLCDNYSTRLILLSSTRAPDLATAIYDGTWAGADGEFEWAKPVLLLVNMWEGKLTLKELLTTWIEKFARITIDTNLNVKWNETTSATQIYFWRMWCYLYVHGVKRSSKVIKLDSLPRDETLRELLSAPLQLQNALELQSQKGLEFQIKFNCLFNSSWMKQLIESLNDENWKWEQDLVAQYIRENPIVPV